ncbi:hypothetical protein SAMN04489729_0908 [Amycolatopsis lurida]|nr:hypothetical protein SAMN04489729_0908 [Amycolatopsis lurida]
MEQCGTPIFDSLVEETRKAAAGNDTLPRENDSESSEPRTDDGKENK